MCTFPAEEKALTLVDRELKLVLKNIAGKLGKLSGLSLPDLCDDSPHTNLGLGMKLGWQRFNNVGIELLFVYLDFVFTLETAPWDTNPQTDSEAFCAMLEITNKINPSPQDSQFVPARRQGPLSCDLRDLQCLQRIYLDRWPALQSIVYSNRK